MQDDQAKHNGNVTLSTGVVLKVWSINPMLLDFSLRTNLPPLPRPPKVFIEAKGREEENPDHPDYIRAVADYNSAKADLVNDLLMGLGTEIASVPEGFSRPKDKGWADDLEAVGVKVPADGLKRYIYWAKFVAVRNAQDVIDTLNAITENIATPEDKVIEAADSFRNREERRANSKRANKSSR